jgi:drug/metabolite transporter (DMT)-like permease
LLVALGLQRMPMAEMTAITFLAPIVVVLLAQPLLGERIGVLEWIAAVGGLIGVLLIARPSAGLPLTGVVLALAAVGASAAYQMLSRSLARTEQAVAMLFYTALVGTVASGLLLQWTLHGEKPDLLETALFVAAGGLSALGHYLLTLAYREAPASLLGPLNYVQLLWAGLLGWIVFDHVPDATTILGLFVVAGAGALIAFKAHSGTRR